MRCLICNIVLSDDECDAKDQYNEYVNVCFDCDVDNEDDDTFSNRYTNDDFYDENDNKVLDSDYFSWYPKNYIGYSELYRAIVIDYIRTLLHIYSITI